jgi:uncharacterized membrane protein YgaE (UPF0421/DUF939 family)
MSKNDIRIALVTTFAVTLSFFLAAFIDYNAAVVASILALITLRVSLHKSVNEGFGHIIATIIGVFLAYILSYFTINHIFLVFSAILLSFLITKVLKLNNDAITNISITLLILLAPGSTINSFYDRLFGTLIGVFVAIIASYFMLNTNPISRTNILVAKQLDDCANLLFKISDSIYKGDEYYKNNLLNARTLVENLTIIREQANEAYAFSRWFRWSDIQKADHSFYRFVQAEHITLQVRLISRNIIDLNDLKKVEKNSYYDELKNSLLLASNTIIEQSNTIKVTHVNKARLNSLDKLLSDTSNFYEKTIKLDDPELLALNGATTIALNRIITALTEKNFVTDINNYFPDLNNDIPNIIYNNIKNKRKFLKNIFKKNK